MITKIYEWFKKFIKDNYKGLITLLAIYLVFTIELPYSIYSPGGSVNLNERVTIDEGYEVEGSFNMAYVSMVKGSLPFVLISKVIPDWDLVKKSDITADGEDLEEMLKRERLDMQESMDNAIINAYQKAGKTLNITEEKVVISYITKEAKTNLQVGDELLSVDNEEVTSLAELKKIVSSHQEKEQISIKVKRDGKEKEAYAKIYSTTDGLKIGISILMLYEYNAIPEVSIKSKASEAGSSGGLMMSLTVYNKLVEKDITKGKKIVGTGTIDKEGNVGEIGGVKYKLVGAVKNKAEVFICPEENYEEAIKIATDRNYNIKIISAHTFDEALKKLEEL